MRIKLYTKFKILMPLMTILLSLFLYACGGAGSLVADGGITGTGITMGRITNFGSIIVNGIRFDVDNATFIRDGIPSTGQNEFKVGEFVVIKGPISSDGTSGVASEVSFSDLLEGAVTNVNPETLTLQILGQTVKIDLLTVFHGFNALSELTAGNIVEVSGVKGSDGVINATSINLKQTSFIDGTSQNELKGSISNIDLTAQTFTINNITVDYSSAVLKGFSGTSLQNNQYVEIKSRLMIENNTLVASEIELEDKINTLPEDIKAEIEGNVTRFVSASNFDVNGLAVTTTAETKFENGAVNNIALNIFIEVEGTVNTSGILVAKEVTFKEIESISKLEGNIQSIDIDNNSITLSSTIVVIDAFTIMKDDSNQQILSFTINDLAVGDKIKVKGSLLQNGNFLASKLERKKQEEDTSDDEETTDEQSNDEESGEEESQNESNQDDESDNNNEQNQDDESESNNSNEDNQEEDD